MRQDWLELAEHHAALSEFFGKLADWHNVVSWRQTEAEYFRAIENRHYAIALKYRHMAQENKGEGDLMKSVMASIALVLLVMFLVAGMPAVAQDNAPLATNTQLDAVVQPVVATVNGAVVEATLEPSAAPIQATAIPPAPNTSNSIGDALPTRDDLIDTLVKYGLAIALVLIIALTYLFRHVASLLALGTPQYAWEGIKAGGNTIMNDLQQRVKATETPVDDQLYAYFKPRLDEWLAMVDKQRQAAMPLPTVSPGDPASESSG